VAEDNKLYQEKCQQNKVRHMKKVEELHLLDVSEGP